MSLDRRNMKFWDELCGTQLAASIGVTDSSPASLARFDQWYFDFYPYLLDEVAVHHLAGRDVLEIGLGYGSLSQKIAESGARYMGLDIAAGPVAMVRHRLQQCGLPGQALQGSIVTAPFSDHSFDRVITIGCLHHTGDMSGAIDECWRLLRPGGSLTVMVYYAYSYRRWVQAWPQTLKYLRAETFGYRGTVPPASARETLSYDRNLEGDVAPHTDFISVRSFRRLCHRFGDLRYRRRNIAQEPPFARRSRESLLKTRWPDILGLEIYATAVK